ncbi:MAG: orotidine 5'-phosphate decarboxylase [Candidatus Thorarchaeota archaeon]|nr:orotidine 5'-phosphate decarboxylase [Candidatus Thorarchaeota archaeon]
MGEQAYARKLAAASFVRKSRLIIGIDLTTNLVGLDRHAREQEQEKLEKRAIQIVSQTAEYAIAFKFNRQIVLPLGLFDGVSRIIDTIHDFGLTAIMDCKMNDIGNTNFHIAKYYFDAGFDAIIANPLVGWEGGLDNVYEMARHRDRGVITLCYMSHPAANEGYGLEVFVDNKTRKFLYKVFAERALRWGSDGVIVGATYPDKIREIKSILGEKVPIISPGVGIQGGGAKDARDAGATYIVVVRSIVEAEDPSSVAARFAAESK